MLRLLGEVTVDVGTRQLDLGTPKQRCLLAALALDAGRVVPMDRLVERVWGQDVPRRGRATLYSYVSRLRQALVDVDTVEITRRPGGYVLTTSTNINTGIDVFAFRALCANARAERDASEAARMLTRALELWRGDALAGLDSPWAEVARAALDEERVAAQHDRTDALLRAGSGEQLLSDLPTRTAERPFDERVAGQYMLALHQAGRTADALTHYRRIRERLVTELGTEPGTELRQLHTTLLATTDRPPPTATPAAAPTHQLPNAPHRFIGRDHDLDKLDAALAATNRGAPVVISAIAGAGGIGKTWLAVHWAHRNTHSFPDGQLFVDLRGFSPHDAPMTPADALRGFLGALGVEPARIPPDTHAAAAMFRKLVADKRILIVLDNAADSAQVTPLLPGSDTCTTLITSRTALTSLVARHGANHLPLDVLSPAEARALLADRVGDNRATAEPDALGEIVDLCGGFPLALSLAAAQTLIRPRLTLTALATELRDLGLDALADTDPAASLPAVLSLSLNALTPEQATAYALLGTAPGRDIGLDAAASLFSVPRATAADILRGLGQASLLSTPAPGRYQMHDLIRRHAADTADTLPTDVTAAALHRVIDFYVHTASNADAAFNPTRPSLGLTPPATGSTPLNPQGDKAAMRWFRAEHDNLLAVQHVAANNNQHRVTWAVAALLQTHLRRGGHLRDRLMAWTAATAAAAHLSDPAAHVVAHRLLGLAQIEVGQHDAGNKSLHNALALAEQHNDHLNQAHTHRALASAAAARGESHRAREHAERALDLARTLDDPLWEAGALNAVGWYAAKCGDYTAAAHHCQEAYEIFVRHEYVEGQGTSSDSLAYVAHHTGRYADAVNHYRTALARFREIGNTSLEADALHGLGHTHTALGQPDQARQAWQEALALYENQGRAAEAADTRKLLAG